MIDPLRSALQQLIAQWRSEATTSLERWPRGAILPSKKLRQCADDLEEVLTVLGGVIGQQDDEKKDDLSRGDVKC